MTETLQKSSVASQQMLDANIVLLEDVLVSFDGFRALNIKQFSVGRNELRVVIRP